MSSLLTKLLVANRGEIASRIFRTCRRMGLDTVAVFTDVDAEAPFVDEADEAVGLGPDPRAYLDVDRLIGAARQVGADAVHPGFGFLAENAGFAEAVTAAGLLWVGPTPEAIARMGSKREAKGIAEAAGVPVLPGYRGEAQDLATLVAEAEKVGFPLLVKASAGGGGKGMRIVREAAGLESAIERARSEAERSFGDGTLLLERYVERPRHVEIQILGDTHGRVVHLGERECSIQRRHQKVIEESPSPALSPELRARMGAAAVALGERLGYVNAGTVEMILDSAGEFFFLEVNTRLQVEHPVTEMVTGLDLVELQLRVARGEALPATIPEARGWSIECRLYAEDPNAGFLPQSGVLTAFETPAADWLRVDAGVASGSEVSIHYDPMIAKVVVHGADRAEAVARMRWALSRTVVTGIVSNRDHLLEVLGHPAFRAGELSTHFLEEHLAEPTPLPERVLQTAAASASLDAQARRPKRLGVSGYRNNRFQDQIDRYRLGDREIVVTYRDLGGERFRVTIDGGEAREVQRLEAPGPCRFEIGGHRFGVRVIPMGDRVAAIVGPHTVHLEVVPRFPDRSAASAIDGCAAPMPGQILEVQVAVGDRVEGGQSLMTMEAMKMEHRILAPHDGVVTRLDVKAGDQVSEGQLLAVVGD